MHPKDISILDYTYSLPDDRIAAFPLPERDHSKLLIYKNGLLQEDRYKNIPSYLPKNSLLVFNDTRVIQARILFQKSTGAFIEIFCLEPYEAINEYSTVMAKKEKLRWKCLIGGASKWKDGKLTKHFDVQNSKVELQARLVEKLTDAYVVELSWQPGHFTFAEIIEQAGDTPLPPYIKRKAGETDKERYQTIYAKYDGSVAAPTAGLHFTPAIFSSITAKNISSAYVTLHVGAGTFKPVKSGSLQGHQMHAEWIDVTAATISKLLDNNSNYIIAVGTTSLRTLESLYWMGVKAMLYPDHKMDELTILQWDVYESPLKDINFSATEALTGLLMWMKKNNCDRLIIRTQILIAPGYHFKMVKAIITNFHQPQSTLLLLVAAAIGTDWKKVYNYAMENDFRFLSYGDGSLLFLTDGPGEND
ncbi:MAG: S-adenosylmethionine:tRNA ribosyltransferase-isomerase [Ferruginibacter sp.]